MKIGSYKNLIVWQKAVDLVEQIYLLAGKFPKNETYGLSNQMQRAAISIASNIAEGQQRNSIKEYIQFLKIACGSVAELDTQLIIAKRIFPMYEYAAVNSLMVEIQKMLNVLVRNLKNKNLQPSTSNLKPISGFTMVELLVAIALFATIITIASGVFIKSMRTQRFAAALMAASGNAQLVLEQMAREMRTSQNFSPLGGELRFVNAKGESVIYRFRNAAIEREVNGNARVLTAENVLVQNLKFIVTGNLDTDGYPPKITSILQVGAKGLPFENAVVNLQTTISSRILDG